MPVRVPVEKFVPSRAQRRAWHRSSAELTVRDLPPTFHSDHFSLYQRYLEQRHPGGHMAEEASETSYRRFLIEPWGGVTRFIELRLGTRLAAVAVTDVLEHGLSAVYTFFDPALAERSLGTCAILIQIMQARRMGLAHLYLGYWIKASEKMRYKDRFRAIEAWDGRQWITSSAGRRWTWTHAPPVDERATVWMSRRPPDQWMRAAGFRSATGGLEDRAVVSFGDFSTIDFYSGLDTPPCQKMTSSKWKGP